MTPMDYKFKNILIVRNDKLGDFILALPSFAMLKASLPNTKIVALVPEYTAPIAKHVPYIDKVIIYIKNLYDKVSQQSLLWQHNSLFLTPDHQKN